MAEIVKMPKLSDTMTEGVVAEWHKNVGDTVKSGDLLADIETDKATMEFESFQEGVLLYRGVEKGKAAPVDSVLAILGKKGEDVKAILEEEKKKAAKEDEKKADKEAVAKAPEKAAEPVAAKATKSEPTKRAVVSAPVQVVKEAGVANGRLKASPLAKKLAKEMGVNISMVRGSGDGGRVVKRDVEHYSPMGGMAFTGVESYTDEPVSQMRKTISRRLSESKFTAPHFYLTSSIDMTEAIKAREAINTVAPVKISFNDIIVKAVAIALRQHPQVNSAWMGENIRHYDHIHIGVAVAVEEGLLVPVVRFADGKTLSQIATEVKEFAQKAKDKKLQPEDWEGNTFTISNLGMFDIDEFTAIINPPDACILAIGSIQEIPVVKNGQLLPGNVMKVTMSCDHRVVDGVTGAKFLQTLKQMLENPVLLLGMQSI